MRPRNRDQLVTRTRPGLRVHLETIQQTGKLIQRWFVWDPSAGRQTPPSAGCWGRHLPPSPSRSAPLVPWKADTGGGWAHHLSSPPYGVPGQYLEPRQSQSIVALTGYLNCCKSISKLGTKREGAPGGSPLPAGGGAFPPSTEEKGPFSLRRGREVPALQASFYSRRT